jgi:uncharacterized damage-inducible protein DinB
MAIRKAKISAMLLEQFTLAHTHKYWFPDLGSAVKGLTVKEALWKPERSDHSVWEIVSHIYYWNNRFLTFYKNRHPGEWIGDNNNTFIVTARPTPAGLRSDLKKLEAQSKEFARQIRGSGLAKLNSSLSKSYTDPWFSILMHLSAHTAYHTGQIVMLRKMHKTWKKKYGV